MSPLNRGAREAPEQLVAFGGGGRHDFFTLQQSLAEKVCRPMNFFRSRAAAERTGANESNLYYLEAVVPHRRSENGPTSEMSFRKLFALIS